MEMVSGCLHNVDFVHQKLSLENLRSSQMNSHHLHRPRACIERVSFVAKSGADEYLLPHTYSHTNLQSSHQGPTSYQKPFQRFLL